MNITDAIHDSLSRHGAPVLLRTDCAEVLQDWIDQLAGEAIEQDYALGSGSFRFRGTGQSALGTPRRWDVRVLKTPPRVAKFPVTRRTLEIRVGRLQTELDEVMAAVRRDYSIDSMTALVVAVTNLRDGLRDLEEA